MSWTTEITERGTLILFDGEGYSQCWLKLHRRDDALAEITRWRKSRTFQAGPVRKAVRDFFKLIDGARAAKEVANRRNKRRGHRNA